MEPNGVVSEVAYLLDQLETLVDRGRRIPFGHQVLVDKEEIKTAVEQIRHALPEEVRQAQWVIKERDRIIEEAGREADRLMTDALSRVHQLAGDSEIVKEAQERADGIIRQAEQRSGEMRVGAIAYVDDMLRGLDEELTRLKTTVDRDRQALKPSAKVANES